MRSRTESILLNPELDPTWVFGIREALILAGVLFYGFGPISTVLLRATLTPFEQAALIVIPLMVISLIGRLIAMRRNAHATRQSQPIPGEDNSCVCIAGSLGEIQDAQTKSVTYEERAFKFRSGPTQSDKSCLLFLVIVVMPILRIMAGLDLRELSAAFWAVLAVILFRWFSEKRVYTVDNSITIDEYQFGTLRSTTSVDLVSAKIVLDFDSGMACFRDETNSCSFDLFDLWRPHAFVAAIVGRVRMLRKKDK